MFLRSMSLLMRFKVPPAQRVSVLKRMEIISNHRQFYKTKGATREATLIKHQGKYDFQTEIERIATSLGMTSTDATALLRKMPDIYRIDTSRLKETCSILEEFGFNPQTAILKCPRMTTFEASSFRTRLRIVIECGLYVQMNPILINQFCRVLSLSPRYLKQQNYMDKSFNVVEKLGEKLNLPQISSSLEGLSDDEPLNVLRGNLLMYYLSEKLDWSRNVAEKISRKIASDVVISELPLVMDALLETWKFHRNMIYKRPNLLKYSHEHLISLYNTGKLLDLEYFPNIVRQQPLILRLTSSRLRESTHILHKHGLSKEVFKKSPELLLISPDTIEQRLITIEKTPKLRVLKTNHRIGDIVYYLPKVFKNLDKLDSSYPEYSAGAPVCRLVGSYKQFDHFLQVNVRRCTDFINFLIPYFPSKGSDAIAIQLYQHPHASCFNMLTTQETLEYLRALNYDSDLIFSALPIVLYPKDTVEEAIKKLVESGEADIHSLYFLHLVLYYIEKPFDWSGDGLFVGTEDKHDEENDVDDEFAESIEY